MLASTLPVHLSSATVRNILSELMELGLVEQPHTSAGRVPTERGLRVFVDELLDQRSLGDYERRTVARELQDADTEESMHLASQLLSESTHQLGFVVSPRLDRVRLRHASLIRLSSERVLVVLVSHTGVTYRRVIEVQQPREQTELDRIAATLNRLLDGNNLVEVRARLDEQVRALRSRARHLAEAALDVMARLLARAPTRDGGLVIATHFMLFDQPEFRDPERLRTLLEAIETGENLVEFLDGVLDRPGVAVAIGDELGEPALAQCAVVSAAYGRGDAPLGLVGVLGPRRMDYARVIPMVDYFSELVSEKFDA